MPADVQQQMAVEEQKTRPGGKQTKAATVLTTPGVMEDWIIYGVNRADYAGLPDETSADAEMRWVVANFSAKAVDLSSAPSFAAITQLRECKVSPAEKIRFFQEYRRHRRQADGQTKRTDDGRDLANTLRRLAKLRAESESLARKQRAEARAAV